MERATMVRLTEKANLYSHDNLCLLYSRDKTFYIEHLTFVYTGIENHWQIECFCILRFMYVEIVTFNINKLFECCVCLRG